MGQTETFADRRRVKPVCSGMKMENFVLFLFNYTKSKFTLIAPHMRSAGFLLNAARCTSWESWEFVESHKVHVIADNTHKCEVINNLSINVIRILANKIHRQISRGQCPGQ